MRRFAVQHIAAAALSCYAVAAHADDELVVYVFQDGAPAAGLTAALDGGAPQIVGNDGSVVFDLGEGAHRLVLSRDDETLHVLRFNAASGQYVDVNVALSAHGQPRDSIERYFDAESAVERAEAPKGSVSGLVTQDGAPLAGATVGVRGAAAAVQTDASGRYALRLPRGHYTLVIQHDGNGAAATSDVRIVGNIDKHENFAIGGSAGDDGIAEIVVSSSLQPRAFEENERFATNVIDTLGIEELARYGDSEVSASVLRVPSVTVQDDRYVFIRGLGGRYVTTTLNGATLPSTDPSKRTVPLDLFPSNIVSQLDVRKTFIASMPGESTGGNLVINTRSFPQAAAGKLSLTLGYIPGLTGDDVASDPSRNFTSDLLGWDHGNRDVPGGVEGIAAALEYSDEYSDNVQQELRRVGGILLKDHLDLDRTTATPKLSFGANYGDVYGFGGGEFGFFVAGNYKNGWSQRDKGVARTYSAGGSGNAYDDFDFVESSNDIDASGLLSLGLNLGANTFQANTVVSRVTENRVRVSQGLDGDSAFQSYRYTIDWIERQFLSQQLLGEHVLGAGGRFTVNWQLTGSQARRYAPDRREVRFDLREGDDVYNLQVPNLLRRYDDLTDNNVDGALDFAYKFEPTDFGVATLSFGAQAIHRKRDADSQSYGYDGGLQSGVDDNAPNRLVSDVLTVDNITGDPGTGFAFQDKTQPSDSYEAELDLDSAWLSYDLMFLERYQIVLGGRYEHYRQTTDTFQLAGDQSAVRSVIDENTFLPTLSFNWFIDDVQQLRFAATRTVSRPDFKETSNAVFYDQEFNFRVRGNPNLKISKVTNLDLRWERYWSENESLSVALFYKDFTDPIERVVQAASGTAGNSRTFQNADSAYLYGVEVDTRRNLAFGDAGRNAFVAFNGSYIDSKVKLDGGDARKLQGQPDYTVNLVLGYDDVPTAQQLTLLLNQNGKNIVDVGVSGRPDVIEEPRLKLDLNYKINVVENFAFKAKVGNLLNSKIEFTQGGKVFQRYETGVELEAGIDWKF
ncbi:TonB-dependent receptor [Solimonas marina]|uniref:TonB-dependent receptor n=1 Tax=Solimonas marina TaxID=2714601 RepID=A0A969WB39_9GAMM|nr:TonB-dependent receptor [Solimonas marina]NKF22231.1 TonB-dependent receptor [Solimonas marina]